MTAELGDPQATKAAFRDALEEVSRERVMEALKFAADESNRILEQQTPPPGASMDDWNMGPIIDSVTSRWDESRQVGIVEWEHEHAGKIEVGVKPHLIEGEPLLVFEGEDGETVFTTEVEHPGIPALGFIRKGMRKALNKYFD